MQDDSESACSFKISNQQNEDHIHVFVDGEQIGGEIL